MNLRNEFLAFIKRNKLFNLDDRVLLTVSGGLDSVVMMDLFDVCEIDFGIAHCNFQLRGSESDGDESFVKALAKKYNKSLYTNHFKTREFAVEHGISIQMAARELRYAWFETIRESKEYAVIATAHHKDDSVETILFNLIKGTGLDGIRGIPVRNGNVVRPLLYATRKELEEYASRGKIDWREDSSNMATDYARNKIRIDIIPKLLEINPGFKDSITRSVDRINDIRSFCTNYIEGIVKRAVKVKGTDIFIDKTEIKDMGSCSLLYEFIRDYGFNYDQAESIWGLIDQGSGKQFFSNLYVLLIDRLDLIISIRDVTDDEVMIIEADDDSIRSAGYKMKLKQFNFTRIDKGVSSNIAQIDFDKLNFPLKVRPWNMGDYFYPLGMEGKKKLSDFMIDIKIPVNLKRRIKIVESGGEIIWIAGYRIDERYKLTKDTKRVYQIEFF